MDESTVRFILRYPEPLRRLGQLSKQAPHDVIARIIEALDKVVDTEATSWVVSEKVDQLLCPNR